MKAKIKPAQLPVWGAPVPASPKKAQESEQERKRREKFHKAAMKPVDFHQNIRTANGSKHYDYVCIEALYQAFVARMLEELFIPTEYHPSNQVPLHRRPKPALEE